MSLDDTKLSEIQKSLTLIDASLRRIALALEAIAHKTDERFRTPAEVQREQARQHVASRAKSKKGEIRESRASDIPWNVKR